MAAEAVGKIRETEEKGREIIKKAGDEAKRILSAAREEGAARRKSLLEEAGRERESMLRAAAERAGKRCEAIAAEGAAERERILSPESSRMESAVRLVMERIVSV